MKSLYLQKYDVILSSRQILKSVVPSPVRKVGRKQVDNFLYYTDNLLYYIWKYRLKEDPILEKPIFMVGCPRSGTSISVKLFATHPWVANWSEAGRIWDSDSYDDPDAEHYWGADKIKEETAKYLHARFEYYRRSKNKKRFINKHPRNSVRIDYIRGIFPDAFFIHIIRDGRAVVNSMLNAIQKSSLRQKIPFGNFCKPPNSKKFIRDDPVEQAALQWREIVSYVRSKRGQLGDRYLELKYEDICSKPIESFASAFEFAELPVSKEFLSGIPESMKSMNYKHRDNLSQEEICRINTIQKDLLQKLGYDV